MGDSPEQDQSARMTADELLPLNAWLGDEGFQPEHVTLTIYRDNNLVKMGSTHLVVGYGDRDGETQGFVAEFDGNTLVKAQKIHHDAARHHKHVARSCVYSGTRLYEGLAAKSDQTSPDIKT